jgi:hypothetical protein
VPVTLGPMAKDADERFVIEGDPEDALRALLAVDPDEDEDPYEQGMSRPAFGRCPQCFGVGWVWTTPSAPAPAVPPEDPDWHPCRPCGGTGKRNPQESSPRPAPTKTPGP